MLLRIVILLLLVNPLWAQDTLVSMGGHGVNPKIIIKKVFVGMTDVRENYGPYQSLNSSGVSRQKAEYKRRFSIDNEMTFNTFGFRYKNMGKYLNAFPASAHYYRKCQNAATVKVAALSMFCLTPVVTTLLLNRTNYEGVIFYPVWAGLSISMVGISHAAMRNRLEKAVLTYNRAAGY